MLTIVDLKRNEELSSSSMRKVAGGEEPIPGGGNGSRSGGTTGEGPVPDPGIFTAVGAAIVVVGEFAGALAWVLS